MARILPQRLQAILGRPLELVTEGDLQRLVGLREDADLDFKSQTYGATDADRRELAADVASFANARGGLIVIGMQEKDGEAVALAPVALKGEETLRMQQVVVSRVAPAPELRFAVVTAAAGGSYVLLAIPWSGRRPHAVQEGSRLRYPIRDGAGKRLLAESEVANLYRDRFLLAGSQVQRLDEVMAEGLEKIERVQSGWLVLALAPEVSGSLELRSGIPDEIEQWARSFNDRVLVSWWFTGRAPHVRIGYRRLILTEAGSGSAKWFHGELHRDGCGFVAGVVTSDLHERMGLPVEVEDWIEKQAGQVRLLSINDEVLARGLVNLVAFLAGHAVENCDAWGDAVVEARIALPTSLGPPATRAGLFQARAEWPGMLEETTLAYREIGPARHTVSLDELSLGGGPTLLGARLPLADLVSGFGLAEPYQISSSGSLRRRYFDRRSQDALKRWADAHGVDLSDDVVRP